jgi:hypothetical protein
LDIWSCLDLSTDGDGPKCIVILCVPWDTSVGRGVVLVFMVSSVSFLVLWVLSGSCSSSVSLRTYDHIEIFHWHLDK